MQEDQIDDKSTLDQHDAISFETLAIDTHGLLWVQIMIDI